MTRDELVAGAFLAIQNGSKSFRAASRLFDPLTRERSWLLYCWCRHCDDVCDGQKFGFAAPGPRGSVEQLRARTAAALGGAQTGELPFDALAQLLRECPIPHRLIDDHLAGFALDEKGWSPTSEQDLIDYCYHVAGAVGCMMAVIMGVAPQDSETLAEAADLGIAFQLSNIARDIGDDLRDGRCYLPADWLAEAVVDRETLLAQGNRQALCGMVEKLIGAMEVHEARARRGVPKLPFRSRLAVLTALRIYGRIGRRVRAEGWRAWDHRVTVGKSEKLALLIPSLAESLFAGRRG